VRAGTRRRRLWLGATIAAAAAVAAGGAFAASGRSTVDATWTRTATDLPDDLAGPQVHFLYVVPRDGEDRAFDTSSTIERSVLSWERWLTGQTGGRGMRVDTYRGALDVSFFRLATDDAVVASRGEFVRDQIEAELYAAGYTSASKIYAVYYDGSSKTACGGADPRPSIRGAFAALYLKGTPPGGAPCNSISLGLDPPGYHEFAMLHEIVHTLGFVPRCAPHARGDYDFGHVSDSRYDLMWTGSEPWGVFEPEKMQLDVGHDDYYGHGRSDCPDLAASPFLASLQTVSVTVNGPGTVRSSTATIDCPGRCTATLLGSVPLTAAPLGDALFKGWGGACSGTGACVATGNVTALFVSTLHHRSLTLGVRAQRATGVLRVDDGYAPCRVGAAVVVERRVKAGWSTVGRARTTGAGVYTVPVAKGRATYRARAPIGTASGQKCLETVSRAVTVGR